MSLGVRGGDELVIVGFERRRGRGAKLHAIAKLEPAAAHSAPAPPRAAASPACCRRRSEPGHVRGVIASRGFARRAGCIVQMRRDRRSRNRRGYRHRKRRARTRAATAVRARIDRARARRGAGAARHPAGPPRVARRSAARWRRRTRDHARQERGLRLARQPARQRRGAGCHRRCAPRRARRRSARSRAPGAARARRRAREQRADAAPGGILRGARPHALATHRHRRGAAGRHRAHGRRADLARRDTRAARSAFPCWWPGARAAATSAHGAWLILDADAGHCCMSRRPTRNWRRRARASNSRARAAHASWARRTRNATSRAASASKSSRISPAPSRTRNIAVGAGRRGLRPAAHRVPVPGPRDARPTKPSSCVATSRSRELLGPRPLVIRTLDVGGDKPIAYLPLPPEENPALGLRGIRTSLWRPELLRLQLRALLRGAARQCASCCR